MTPYDGFGVRWGTNVTYRGRTHVVFGDEITGICGLPVDRRHDLRPGGYRICPECAIGYVAAVFPVAP